MILCPQFWSEPFVLGQPAYEDSEQVLRACLPLCQYSGRWEYSGAQLLEGEPGWSHRDSSFSSFG